MYVCICYAVTDLHVDAAIRAGATTEDEIGAVTGAGTGCGGCRGRLCERLASTDARSLASHAVALSA